jgi:hypothetical protein
MKQNEESELKGNLKILTKEKYMFPIIGPVNIFYNFFYLFHKLTTVVYIPFKAAFEQEPTWGTVYFDFYLDLIFFIDIVIIFNMPLYDKKSRLITDRKFISMRYIKSWFIFDLIVLLPLSYFRKISVDWPNSKDDM